MGLQECGLNLDATRKELLPHGTLEFPCAAYAEEHVDRPGDEVPWHWHEELEIIYAASGALRVQIPAAEYLLPAGGCVVINSGVLHSAFAQPRCELHSLVFSPLLLSGSQDSVYARKYFTPLTKCRGFRAVSFDRTADRREIEDFTQAFRALALESPGFELTVREKLSDLCFALFCRFGDALADRAAPLRQDDLRMQKMLALIQTKYGGDLTLAEIARAADIGERECMRCFGRTIHLPPMQYLLKYRVMRGAELLRRSPAEGVSEIAAACGFDSPSNFSRQFRRFYNCTPREYRKTDAQKPRAVGKP